MLSQNVSNQDVISKLQYEVENLSLLFRDSLHFVNTCAPMVQVSIKYPITQHPNAVDESKFDATLDKFSSDIVSSSNLISKYLESLPQNPSSNEDFINDFKVLDLEYQDSILELNLALQEAEDLLLEIKQKRKKILQLESNN